MLRLEQMPHNFISQTAMRHQWYTRCNNWGKMCHGRFKSVLSRAVEAL